jgi:hypothetical protein
VVTRLRGRSRAAYRLYGEEEYLAGADALADWNGPPTDEPVRGRRLQRLAGAAALTGAVGTVGGVVGLAGLRAHPAGRREIARRIVPSVQPASVRGHVRTPARAVRRSSHRPSSSRRVHARRGTPRGTQVRLSPGHATGAETPARALAMSAPQAGAAQSAPAEVHAGTRAQSEFGFER